MYFLAEFPRPGTGSNLVAGVGSRFLLSGVCVGGGRGRVNKALLLRGRAEYF